MRILNLALLVTSLFLSYFSGTLAAAEETAEYDYIVVGSGPGGGPLAANLAKAGASVLLLEAGEDQGENLNELVAGWFFLANNDPVMRWDFFVKYSSDDAITNKFRHLTWRTTDGQFYVGTSPPAGATKLGVYYPRAGTLGGCSTHNAMCAPINPDSDWDYIAELTGDASWNATNMRKYFERLEKNNYLAAGTRGHGFDGYLDITINDNERLNNETDSHIVLKEVARQSGQDPEKVPELVKGDLNNASPDRDQQTGIWGFPAHRDPKGRRSSSRNPVVDALNAVTSTGEKKNKLTLSLTSFVTKVLFDQSGKTPKAIGVEYLFGKSMYQADPRYNASSTGVTKQAYARKEVIISGGAFNSPQILKLSGVGPKAELEKFNIPVVLDSPGVGNNLQDNQEFGVIAHAAKDLAMIGPDCTYGAPGDPCLAAWYEGKGPYTVGPLDAVMFKSSNATERDVYMWAATGSYRGYWPAQTVNIVPADPPSTFGFPIVKFGTENRAGYVNLVSNNPREVPDINFRFFEGDSAGDGTLSAMVEAVEYARRILDAIPAPLGPFTEVWPCEDGSRSCDVKQIIREQTWSHHATSTCSIGPDSNPMAVLDSRYRVKGIQNLRVVDGSAFPRVPGAFPVIATFMLSEKATDVILEDSWHV